MYKIGIAVKGQSDVITPDTRHVRPGVVVVVVDMCSCDSSSTDITLDVNCPLNLSSGKRLHFASWGIYELIMIYHVIVSGL